MRARSLVRLLVRVCLCTLSKPTGTFAAIHWASGPSCVTWTIYNPRLQHTALMGSHVKLVPSEIDRDVADKILAVDKACCKLWKPHKAAQQQQTSTPMWTLVRCQDLLWERLHSHTSHPASSSSPGCLTPAMLRSWKVGGWVATVCSALFSSDPGLIWRETQQIHRGGSTLGVDNPLCRRGSRSRVSERRSTLTSAFHPGTDVSCCRVADARAGSPAGSRTRSSTIDAS
ncbi:hypothetical protein LZ31DRAFT_103751 [Colletotrichum somersetense]|nr:hypothetical protein LZ31DRAFT_103751 [Colletotrichum somersetense]